MTSIEGAALAGGRLLGKLAVPAAKALARKVWFRRSVARRVRKKVGFRCSWHTYRAWLKTITAEELSRPLEDISGLLAVRLDGQLSQASAEWQANSDHLSRALNLVELTYPAIAAALGDADHTELTEAWAQERSAQSRALLIQLAGPGAALSPTDLAAVLQQRSVARRAVRLQAFDLDQIALDDYFARVAVPKVPVGQVVVLLGDFGAGKSEVAETWHRAAINALTSTADAPLPVWLRAREVAGQTLEDAVDRQVGAAWRQGRGACIVVDGLDETDVATAQALLDGARVLGRSHAGVRVLMTARPGVLTPTDDEKVEATLLSEEDAIALVELVSSKEHSTWRWTAGLRTTVRRPFFALAAGAMLRGVQAPQGEADLIRTLVENSLERGTERTAVTKADTRSVLMSLAISLTAYGADGLSFSDRQVARSSRLVAHGPDGGVLFSLPIFQHWFAAQAILDGAVSPQDVVASSSSFNQWRWAAAVATLSAPTPVVVDDLLSTWIAGNPGAGGWILKEAFSESRSWRAADDKALDPATSGPRLLRAVRTWTDALGPLAEGVLPDAIVNGPVGLGVEVSGHLINAALATTRPAADYVTDLPPGVHPFVPEAVPEWRPWFSGTAPETEAWPWILLRNLMAEKTLRKFNEDPYLGAPDGIWTQERRYDTARRVLGRRSRFRAPLPGHEARSKAEKLFDAIGRNPNSMASLGSRPVLGAELEALITWIDRSGIAEIEAHLPEEDITTPASGWVWDFYSPNRLMEFEVEVYGRACAAYDEAMTNTFSQLGWSMPSAALQPFGVVLEVRRHEEVNERNTPELTVVRAPMPLMQQLAPTGPDVVWSASGRAVISPAPATMPDNDWERHYATLDTISSWLAEQHKEPLRGLAWTRTGADDMSEARPSSAVAARWLWDDLKTLGLGEGTFPQLR